MDDDRKTRPIIPQPAGPTRTRIALLIVAGLFILGGTYIWISELKKKEEPPGMVATTVPGQTPPALVAPVKQPGSQAPAAGGNQGNPPPKVAAVAGGAPPVAPVPAANQTAKTATLPAATTLPVKVSTVPGPTVPVVPGAISSQATSKLSTVQQPAGGKVAAVQPALPPGKSAAVQPAVLATHPAGMPLKPAGGRPANVVGGVASVPGATVQPGAMVQPGVQPVDMSGLSVKSIPSSNRLTVSAEARALANRTDPCAPVGRYFPFPRVFRAPGSVVEQFLASGKDGKKVPANSSKLTPPPPPPGSGPAFAVPPPPNGELSVAELPAPPSKPSLAGKLKLVAIIADKAVMTFSDRVMAKENKWPRTITLAPGEQFESVSVVGVKGDSVTIEEDGERSVKTIGAVR